MREVIRRTRTYIAGVVAVTALLGVAPALSRASALSSPLPVADMVAAATPGAITLDGSPGFPPVANPATDTVYVPIQCQNGAACNHTALHVVDLIDSATCKVDVTSDCHIIAAAAAGDEPETALVDRRTDTIFIGDARGGPHHGGALTVIDGATCNVSDTSGCATPVATIPLAGAFPTGLTLDPATGTLYVSSLTGFVDVLNVSHCNAISATSCGPPVASVPDDQSAIAVALDPALDSVYVVNAPGEVIPGSVSVINGATCNGTDTSGCGQITATVGVGTNPQWAVVDQHTDTVYVANANSGSISLIDAATCNGTDSAGCAQTPPTVLAGTGDNFLGLDQARHTLFAINQIDDTISELNLRTCNALDPARCPAEARNEQMPYNPPSGEPANTFALVAGSNTAYIVNAGGENLLAPVSIGGCDALDTARCRVEAPHVAAAEFFPVVDTATHTIYAANAFADHIDVYDADTCRAGHVAACTPIAEIPTVGPEANLQAIDDTTHTLYVGNALTAAPDTPASTISVVNIAHCSAIDTSGCDAPAATINVGRFPGPPALNPATDTLYDVYGIHASRLAVIDIRHCTAQDDSGCGRRPVSMRVPPNAAITAVSEKTDTVYQQSLTTDQVAVINGATCNGAVHTGCGHITATIAAPEPSTTLVNDATNTLYISDGGSQDDDMPGAVSLVNTLDCNGSHPSGCGQNWPTVSTGRVPQGLALDPATGDVYVADYGSAGVSVIEGRSCNAMTPGDCRQPTRFIPTAGHPETLAVDPLTDTVYSTNSIGYSICCGGTTSLAVFRGRP